MTWYFVVSILEIETACRKAGDMDLLLEWVLLGPKVPNDRNITTETLQAFAVSLLK